MRRKWITTASLAVVVLAVREPLSAHPVPFSYVDVRVRPGALDVTVVAHVFDFAHDLTVQPPDKLLDPATLESHSGAIRDLLRGRLQLTADGAELSGLAWSNAVAVPERQSVRLQARYSLRRALGKLVVAAVMFPYDPQHKTFVNFYEDDAITAQTILDKNRTRFEYFAGTRQGRWAVLQKFVPAGVHHILIGQDHLLFLVGLLLMGGTIRQLLFVVTAFTIAHSITLSLAALRIVIPPANAIEPAIALSVIYVGADNLLVSAGGRDTRAWIAFAFGLIHGFGFANVLREMDLPGRALGWSLFGFNVGVEIGQLFVVVLVASVVAWIRTRSEVAGRRLAFAGSIIVMAAGAFWFVQRVFFSGGTA
jgi:hydrogenase/urease accessory protein HupE